MQRSHLKLKCTICTSCYYCAKASAKMAVYDQSPLLLWTKQYDQDLYPLVSSMSILCYYKEIYTTEKKYILSHMDLINFFDLIIFICIKRRQHATTANLTTYIFFQLNANHQNQQQPQYQQYNHQPAHSARYHFVSLLTLPPSL